MLPDLNQWKSWGPLERASYVAQIATACAFLASSLFSFLSWREAAQTREEQKQFFRSEKAPVLDVLGANENNKKFGGNLAKTFNVYIKNIGGSPAQIKSINIDTGLLLTPQPVFGACLNYIVEKDRTVECEFLFSPLEESVANIKRMEIEASKTNAAVGDNFIESIRFTIELQYVGLFEDKHNLIRKIAVRNRKLVVVDEFDKVIENTRAAK
ncbi:hypothetical protein [Methylobacterium sp. WL9]|uniref:hypothetical protein n=1 Tax=Methylobacterium sp. WL9 TaxID=2603898 RepID=UPI0011CA9522|nr:hypothetical protein [Methylobacterium sp. WL9]TXN21271.1 hypothetical protein FV217_14845 [Methylobacterium sp. WL9]